MIKKRSKFFTFCLALLPGAGHMYLGFMKLGLFFLSLFIGTIFISSYLFEDMLMFLLPVIYIYSFFDAMNKVTLSADEFYLLEDYFPIVEDNSSSVIIPFIQKNKFIIGITVVIAGCNLFFQIALALIGDLGFLPDFIRQFFYSLSHRVSQLFFAFVIIYLGLKLIAGKRESLHKEPYDFLEEHKNNSSGLDL